MAGYAVANVTEARCRSPFGHRQNDGAPQPAGEGER